MVRETGDGTGAVRTGVSLLADGPLLQADQVEEMRALRDDGPWVLQVEVADAADIPVLGQLGLGGRGQGGVQFPDAISPGKVERNKLHDANADIHQVEEENEKAVDWPVCVLEEKSLTDTQEDDGHSIEELNCTEENMEVILEFLRVWVFLGLVAVPGDDDVDGDDDQALHSRHQAGGQDGETPGGGDQCSRGEEVVDSGERKDEATEVEDEGREMSVEGNVGGR